MIVDQDPPDGDEHDVETVRVGSKSKHRTKSGPESIGKKGSGTFARKANRIVASLAAAVSRDVSDRYAR